MLPSDTPAEPLSEEQLAWLRHMLGGTSPLDLLVVSLLDEHARLKATVERVRSVRARFSYAAAVPGDFVAQKLDEALSPDASTTDTNRRGGVGSFSSGTRRGCPSHVGFVGICVHCPVYAELYATRTKLEWLVKRAQCDGFVTVSELCETVEALSPDASTTETKR